MVALSSMQLVPVSANFMESRSTTFKASDVEGAGTTLDWCAHLMADLAKASMGSMHLLRRGSSQGKRPWNSSAARMTSASIIGITICSVVGLSAKMHSNPSTRGESAAERTPILTLLLPASTGFRFASFTSVATHSLTSRNGTEHPLDTCGYHRFSAMLLFFLVAGSLQTMKGGTCCCFEVLEPQNWSFSRKLDCRAEGDSRFVAIDRLTLVIKSALFLYAFPLCIACNLDLDLDPSERDYFIDSLKHFGDEQRAEVLILN
nr:hypothetical protein DVH24_017818 [Ipomoea batatas]